MIGNTAIRSTQVLKRILAIVWELVLEIGDAILEWQAVHLLGMGPNVYRGRVATADEREAEAEEALVARIRLMRAAGDLSMVPAFLRGRSTASARPVPFLELEATASS